MNSYREILESLLGILELNKDTDWTQTDVSEEFQAIIEYIEIRMSKVQEIPILLMDHDLEEHKMITLSELELIMSISDPKGEKFSVEYGGRY